MQHTQMAWLVTSIALMALLLMQGENCYFRFRQAEQSGQLHSMLEDANASFTVVINTFRRRDQLLAALGHYSQCAGVQQIRVLWSEDAAGPPADDAPYWAYDARVRYDVQPSASLNLRFAPLPGLRTDAVLSLDDDIIVPCADLLRTFAVWRQQPRQLVGWFPRAHSGGPEAGGYSYHLKVETLLWRAEYSIVLTKGAFLHRDYLEAYSAQPPGVLALVDTLHNCEDLAMAFLVANATAAPPAFVHVPCLRDAGQGPRGIPGISSAVAHVQARSSCLDLLAASYGRLPLVARTLASHEGAWALRMSAWSDGLWC